MDISKKLNPLLAEETRWHIGDGCFYLQKKNKGYYPRIKIVTTSQSLANQLKFEINKLNIKATRYIDKRKNKNWGDLQVIEVRGNIELDKWFNIISPKNPKFVNKYNYFKNS